MADASNEKPSAREEPVPHIDERLEQLKAQGYDKKEITQILYQEGYNTRDIMERHLPLKSLKRKPTDEESVMGAIAGTTRGPGYLNELKIMIQRQIGRSRELTDVFYNVGLGTLLASLRKSGMAIEDFRRIALEQGGLKEALEKAGETVFKALEYYESDLVTKVEDERDEARVYASVMETKVRALMKDLDPKFRLEKMILTYLLSGAPEPDTLMTLIDKWLSIELTEVRMEVISA